MRSSHADTFNHDAEARRYDEDVRNHADPIRAGYDELLAWVAKQAKLSPESSALDLGSGTGNLSARLPPSATLVCVDVSREMTRIAREKLTGHSKSSFVCADLLEYFDRAPGPHFDAVVSTYAIHHLTPPERAELFRRIARGLNPGGRIALGDLMFESSDARDEILTGYRDSGRAELASEIEQEFFWNLEDDLPALRQAGLQVEVKRFSELSWGVAGTLG